MFATILLATQLVCPPPQAFPVYPYGYGYVPYGNPYIQRMPTPDSMKPPPFRVQKAAPQPQRQRAQVAPAPSSGGTYQGPLVIENPYYKP